MSNPIVRRMNQWCMKSRLRWSILGSIAIVLVTAGMVLPAMKRSNCGGNSAALAACSGFVVVLKLWTAEHDGQRFQVETADIQTRRQLGHLPGEYEIHAARLMARLHDVRLDPAAERRVIMVCDRAYDNVPRRYIGRAPLAH